MPRTPRYADGGARSVSTTCAAPAGTTAYSRQPRLCSTRAPVATPSAPEATTSPTAPPSSGASISNGGTYERPSFMRPRMYGSTDMNSLRTSSSPSPGSGTSASARRKSLSRGSPCGRAASRISRLAVGISVSIPTLSTTRADPVAAAEQLAATCAELAPEGERERRLPAPLVAELAEAGLFRLCVPSALGGLEAHPATLVRAVEAVARGDGAAGWCVAIAATSGLVGGYLPEDAARDVYGRPTAIAGGVFAPRGRAVPDGDGYRVTGRWPFASGCTHCDWLMGGCAVDGDALMVLAPASEFQIHDTWHSMGLRGSGSHDIELRDAYIPAERTAALITGTPTASGPLYAFPLFGLLAIAIGAVGLGIARGALDDVIALASARKPTGSSRTMGE